MILRIRSPGRKVRKIKPTTWVITGMARPAADKIARTSVRITVLIENTRHFLIGQSFTGVTNKSLVRAVYLGILMFVYSSLILAG